MLGRVSAELMPGSRPLRMAALAVSALALLVPLLPIGGTKVSATPRGLATPKHKRSPSPSPSPSPTRTRSPSPTPTKERTPSPSPSETLRLDSPEVTATATPSPTDARKKREPDAVWWKQKAKYDDTYSTDGLLELAEEASQFTDSPEMMQAIFSPFIVVGPSTFTDTWGGIRHDEGGKLRPHLGQDVFCEREAPVLAAEPGVVEFADDPLGGRVVRLHHERGGYWYYAHLADFAPGLDSGDAVDTGDVIGECGTSGNAQGTSPHVHFGSYPGPRNPMRDLIGWLEEAEGRGERLVERLIESGMQTRIAERLFGEGLVPAAPDEVVSDDEVLAEPLEVLLGLPL